jgi:CubicO group peptidase (beta-lactamase class C family)
MTIRRKAIFMAIGSLLLVSKLTSCETNPGKTKSEKIAYLVEKAAEQHQFIGNVLVVDKGRTVHKKSYGLANAQVGIPNGDSTKFLIASLSKPFTAILIVKLVEQGKLRLTDGLGKFFPHATSLKIKTVTIHHLLTHTSGIKEFITKEHVFEEADLNDIGFTFDSGSDFAYSNSGYVLLKRIAEISSGKTYSDLVNQLIFIPLHMTSSGVARNVKNIPNLAVGYKDATQQVPDTLTYSLEVVDGAGSLFSTASDMAKFSQGIYSQHFLSKSSSDLLFRQHVKAKYGYGWYLRERGGIWDVAYHKGDLAGFSSFLSRKTTTNQLILLLANAGGLDLADLENDIAKVLKTKE